MKITFALPYLLYAVFFLSMPVASSYDDEDSIYSNSNSNNRNSPLNKLRREDPETLGLLEQVVHAMLVEHSEDNASSCKVTCRLGSEPYSGKEWHISPDFKSMFVRGSSQLKTALVNPGLEVSLSSQCPTSIQIDISIFSDQIDEYLPSSFLQAKTTEGLGSEKKPSVYVRPTTPDWPYRFFNIKIRAKDNVTGETISVDNCRVIITPHSMAVPSEGPGWIRGGGYIPINEVMTEKDIQQMNQADRNTFKVGSVTYNPN